MGIRTRSLLSCGSLAGPLFVGIYSVTGRVAGDYDRRRDAVSTLALTGIGWTQTLNFLVSGSLVCAGAVGVRRSLRHGVGSKAIPGLIAAAGAGLLGAGLFATDTAEETATHGLSRRGALHVVSAVPFFVGLPAAGAVAAYRFGREGRGAAQVVSINAGVLSIVAATLAGSGFSRTEGWLFRRGGTFQRVAVATALVWLAWFAVECKRGEDEDPLHFRIDSDAGPERSDSL